MPDGIELGLAVVALVAAAAYGLLPLLVKATQFLSIRPRYRRIEASEVAPDVYAFMSPVEQSLRAEGFYAVALLRSEGDVPGVTADVMLFVNRESGDTAGVAFVRGGPLTTPTVTFDTTFTDGYSIETTNFADAGTFPRNPKKHRLAIPGLRDVALLCEVHRRRRARLAPPRLAPVVPPPGEEHAYLEREDAAEAARAAAAGYYRLDADGVRYRPTFKGAYLMTWKLMWPVSVLRRSLKRRAARRELAQLRLDPSLV